MHNERPTAPRRRTVAQQSTVMMVTARNRHDRKATERFRCFTYDELMQRDKVSLDCRGRAGRPWIWRAGIPFSTRRQEGGVSRMCGRRASNGGEVGGGQAGAWVQFIGVMPWFLGGPAVAVTGAGRSVAGLGGTLCGSEAMDRCR